MSLSPNRTVKESFSMLSYEDIVRVAKAKRVELPIDNPSKEEVVDAIWEAKSVYVHNMNVYKMKRLIYDCRGRRTEKNIMQYLRIRNNLFDDIQSASIRLLKFKMDPYVFSCEDLWCLGICGDLLLFCSQPCTTNVSVHKKYNPVKFDLEKRALKYQ